MQHCIWFVHFLLRYDAAALDAPLPCAKCTKNIKDIVLFYAECTNKFPLESMSKVEFCEIFSDLVVLFFPQKQ